MLKGIIFKSKKNTIVNACVPKGGSAKDGTMILSKITPSIEKLVSRADTHFDEYLGEWWDNHSC